MNQGMNGMKIIAADAQVYETCIITSESAEQITLAFTLEENAQLELALIIADNSKVRTITIECILNGMHASALIKGAYSAWGDAQIILNTKQMHYAQHTSSTLQMNGIIFDTARIAYHGMIHIGKMAQKSSASQENKTISFSPAARATSIPSLEVLAHQVQCAHASAIGKLDETMISFLQARGLSYMQAQRLLVEGFFNIPRYDSSHSLGITRDERSILTSDSVPFAPSAPQSGVYRGVSLLDYLLTPLREQTQ